MFYIINDYGRAPSGDYIATSYINYQKSSNITFQTYYYKSFTKIMFHKFIHY